MCGIAGWFSHGALVREEAARDLCGMLRQIVHRGPDGEGQAYFRHAALGHRRLAVIDPAGGSQPMTLGNTGLTVSFNGEIYNHRALRANLSGLGHTFRTQSDTEVILAAYRHWGLDALSRLRGMFALALWDEDTQQGLLARDGNGIKPLFYAHLEERGALGKLAFASEAKALRHAGLHQELDPQSLHLFLNFRYVPGERTLFEGVRQLPPGSALRWSPGGPFELVRFGDHLTPISPDLAGVDDSVRTHLVSDVPVGCYLSGGVDSATIAALARRHLSEPPQTFTLNVGDDPREAEHAAATASMLSLPNRQGDFLDVPVRELIYHLEAPKINGAQGYRLAQLAAGSHKVALSGVGADELFFGYNIFRLAHQIDRVTRYLPNFVRRCAGSVGATVASRFERLPWSEARRFALAVRFGADTPLLYGVLRNVWDEETLRKEIYGPRMLDARLPDAFSDLRARWPRRKNPLDEIALFEWREKLNNDLLWNEDRVSMAHGLEVRTPFVDSPLRSAVFPLGSEMLMPSGRLKGYFNGMLRPLLPHQVLARPKSGFQVDAGTFFEKHLSGIAEDYLSPDRVRETGLFNPRFIQRVRNGGPAKRNRWHYFMLYMMLGTHIWLELFEGNGR